MAVKHEDQLPDLVARIWKLRQEFEKHLNQVVWDALGESLRLCIRCRRPMLPRRTWEVLSEEDKTKLRSLVIKENAKGTCMSCGTAKQLSDEEVAKLQRAVGA